MILANEKLIALISMTKMGWLRGVTCTALGLLSLVMMTAVVRAEPRDVLTFCFNDFPPYVFVDADGNNKGLSLKIVTEAVRRMGMTVEYIELPWKRCLSDVRQGIVDGVLDAAARDEFLQGPTSFSSYKDTIWVTRNSPAVSLDDLNQRTIGLVYGYNYSADLLKLIEQNGMITETSIDDPMNARKLAFKRVDAIIGDLVSTAYFAKTNNLKFRVLDSPGDADKLYVSFNGLLKELQRTFDKKIIELKNDGFIDSAYTEYLGQGWSEMSIGER